MSKKTAPALPLLTEALKNYVCLVHCCSLLAYTLAEDADPLVGALNNDLDELIEAMDTPEADLAPIVKAVRKSTARLKVDAGERVTEGPTLVHLIELTLDRVDRYQPPRW